MLKYEDVSGMFSRSSGIKDSTIEFQTVSCFAGVEQPKGLFIPSLVDSGTLQEAISNGAIAAVWRDGEPVPEYTPNHFPLFYTNDLLKGLEGIMNKYNHDLQYQIERKSTTKFVFQQKELLNESDETYDIAVMAERLNQLAIDRNKAGEE